MTEAERQRQAFLDALAADEDDVPTRGVYSDWLDERGEHEEAERQRQWPAAKAWLVAFAGRCGSTCVNYDELWDEYHAAREGRERSGLPEGEGPDGDWLAREVWRPVTYALVVKAGHDCLDSGGDALFVQQGSEAARDAYNDAPAEFWRHWQTVTGRRAEWPDDPGRPWAAGPRNPFSCSC